MWPRIITFDCYGTLVRWPETLRSVFEALLPTGADVASFHQDFSEFHVQLKNELYQPYSMVLSDALDKTMRKWHRGDIPGAQEKLLRAVQSIPPYADVVPVLRSLARQYRIAIISNTEDALIENTVRGLEIACAVITAEQAHAYKPDHRLFTYAHQRLGVAPEDVVHVGAGYATDMVPAFELGLARIWINRRGERAHASMPPTAELPDFTTLEPTIAAIANNRDRDRGTRQ